MKNFLFPCICLLLTSCAKETLQSYKLPVGNLMHAKINGETFSVTDELVVAGFSQVDSITVFLITGSSANSSMIDISSETIGLGLTIVQDEEFLASSQWNTTDEENQSIVVASYSKLASVNNDSNGIESSTENEGGSARIKVTELNKIAKTISGEFEFTAIDDETNKVYAITDGVFKDVPFEEN